MSEELSPKDLSDILWREVAYRHENYWTLLYRVVLAVSALLAFPVVYAGDTSSVRAYAAIFPIIAMFISTSGAWLLMAEALRIRPALEAYKLLTNTMIGRAYLLDRNRKFYWLYSGNVGEVVSILVAVFGLGAGVTMLLSLLSLPLHVVLISGTASAFFAGGISIWAIRSGRSLPPEPPS